jgi:predicted AAA+ superfamily ATPase
MVEYHPAWENLIVMEVIKQLSWSDQALKAYHFRTHKGQEVDVVLESRKKTALWDRSQSRFFGREKGFQGSAISLGCASQEIYQRDPAVYRGSNHEI